LAAWADDKYVGIIAEGWDTFLGWRSPNIYIDPRAAKI